MGARKSPEIYKAMDLIENKKYSRYKAAQETGLHQSTIQRSSLYQEYLKREKDKSVNTK